MMAGATVRAVHEPFQTLFGAGTCAGLSDGQLLARFVAGRDEAGELAFEALVKRHGPMVQGVCRQVLDDPNDVHDALQAVFLVLARRANAIRNRESVGSWLYGVAVRVAARARVQAIRRGIRERRTTKAAQAQAALGLGDQQSESTPVEREERAGVIHHELSRLPEKYRAPIVLCYMEGLTHDEAAACLSWPVGTVRSRLSRGRDSLRRRLRRRGLAAPAVIGPLGGWLAGDKVAIAATTNAISGNLLADVLKFVSQAAAGRCAAVVSSQATSLALADGVLKMFMLKKLMVVAAVLFSIGTITIGGGVALVRTSKAQHPQPKGSSVGTREASLPDVPPKTAEAPDVDLLARQLVDLARRRYERQSVLYNEGAIALDPVIETSEQLASIESENVKSPEERHAVKQRHLTRLKDFEARVATAKDEGRVTAFEVQGIRMRRLQAELDLQTADKEDADLPAILRRLKELERKVDQTKGSPEETRKGSPPGVPARTADPIDGDVQFQELVRLVGERYEYQLKRYLGGQTTIDGLGLIAAYDQLENIELRAAKNRAQQLTVRDRALKRLKGIESIVEAEVKNGRIPANDLGEIRLRRLQVEIDQKNAGQEETDLAAILRRLKELERKVDQLEKRLPAPLDRT